MTKPFNKLEAYFLFTCMDADLIEVMIRQKMYRSQSESSNHRSSKGHEIDIILQEQKSLHMPTFL